MCTGVSYVLLKHFLFGKIHPHSLSLRSSSTENFNSLGHLPLGCSTVVLSSDGPGRDHPGAWPAGCLAMRHPWGWKGRSGSHSQHSNNKPTTNLFPVLYDTGYFKGMARDPRERNSAFMLCCGGEWATVHSRAGQTHLSPGRNLVRPGFPDVSGLGASFPPDSSEPSVITPRMTLWPAPTQTGGGGQSNGSNFYGGVWQRRKPSLPCERRAEQVRQEGRKGRPDCPRYPSSLILTFATPKALCFERLFQNTHPLGVPMGLVCVFLQKDLSGSTVGRCSVSEADRHFEECRRHGSVGYRIWKERKLINSYS